MKSNTSKLMQVLLQRGAAGSLGSLGALAALGLFSADAVAGISNTRHNLTTSQTTFATSVDGDAGANQSTTVGTEICAFCHTPHASNTNISAAPLWNKAVPTNSFTTYSRVTLNAGTSGTAGQPGDNSLICLSCHDGASAMDNMINGPGSYNYNASGQDMNYAFTGGSVSAGGVMSGFAAIAADAAGLSNDHPIGIQYCGGGVGNDPNKATTTGCADSYFNPPADVKTDGLVLFTNSTLSSLTVECGSCHDPHTSAQTSFLRISNTASAVCLSCHNK